MEYWTKEDAQNALDVLPSHPLYGATLNVRPDNVGHKWRPGTPRTYDTREWSEKTTASTPRDEAFAAQVPDLLLLRDEYRNSGDWENADRVQVVFRPQL